MVGQRNFLSQKFFALIEGNDMVSNLLHSFTTIFFLKVFLASVKENYQFYSMNIHVLPQSVAFSNAGTEVVLTLLRNNTIGPLTNV